MSDISKDISSKFKAQIITKNDYFVRYGDKMNKIGILYKGILVSRYSSSEGDEITSKFYYLAGDRFVVDYFSFKNQLDSDEEIQAVEESILLTLSFEDFNYLLEKYSALQKIVSQFAEESYIKGLNRIRDFQLLDALGRVKKFTMTHEAIIDKIKINDKASFLGITRNIYTDSLKKI